MERRRRRLLWCRSVHETAKCIVGGFLGMATDMAKVIEYYIPENFRKKSVQWIPRDQCGKVIQFPVTVKRSA